jgi:TRAP-type C4-dicarboxylate transport system permease small subunit
MQCLKCGNDFDYLYECPVCSDVWRESGKFNRVFTRVEDFLLELFLGVMVLTVLMQILMRNFFQSGITGGDDLIRHLVLWVAFFGAGIATRSKSHVRIDVLTHLLKGRLSEYKDIVINLFSFVVCIILMIASCQFVFIEYQGQGHSQFLNLPVWTMEIVMPLGYLIIAIRFAHISVSGVQKILREKTN